MRFWKATLTYDGTPFHGWQVQPALPTIQGTLAHALHHITGESVLPQGSGRTDTGVHALAQVATFSLTCAIPTANLLRALNRSLPPAIRVLQLEEAPPGFHARHSARSKTYEYRILPSAPGRICSPMLAPYVWDCPHPLDLARLQAAAAHVLGTHDFTSFAASDPDLATRTPNDQPPRDPSPAPPPPVPLLVTPLAPPLGHRLGHRQDPHPAPPPALADIPPPHTRSILHSAWTLRDDLLLYTVTGSGFLHHMVRNLVGTFVEVGTGRLSPADIPRILAACNRSAAGPTAPARGLFLVEVHY